MSAQFSIAVTLPYPAPMEQIIKAAQGAIRLAEAKGGLVEHTTGRKAQTITVSGRVK